MLAKPLPLPDERLPWPLRLLPDLPLSEDPYSFSSLPRL
jgi:hypothetical protein